VNAITPRTAIRFAAFCVLLLSGTACSDGPPSLRSVTRQLHAGDFTRDVQELTGVLTDQRGAPFDLAQETEGRLSYLFFGYTSCPDMCPMTMSNLGKALDLLTPEERARTLPLFVSLDPPRDTKERIAAWLSSFGDDFVGLTGSEEETGAVLDQLGYRMPEFIRPESGPYEVPHPMTVFVVTPDGVVRFGYTHESKAEDIAEDAQRLLTVAW